MSRVDDVIAAETETLEHTDVPDPVPEHVQIQRGTENRDRVFSVRLSESEYAALVEAARQQGLPTRTFARKRLVARQGLDEYSTLAELADRVQHLEEAVFTS